MNTKQSLRGLSAALLTLLAFVDASLGAERPAGLVGDLGRREALRIEGNPTFTKEQILDAMLWHIDYHVAAHPDAPLAEYTARLERKITLGYQHGGFPEVIVKATADPNSSQVIVRVTEGPRYLCGEFLLSGVKTMTNAVIRQKILDTLSGSEPGKPAQTNLSLAFWSGSKPAPLDEFSQKQLAAMVNKALEELNYYQPKVNVRIVPDPARKLADLQVEIADEGVKGIIAEIEVTGLRTNTRQQVLDYLKLKPDMELRMSLVHTISNQLVSSARFFRHDVSLQPRPQVGEFKLELDLEEFREAPPLNQEFAPETKALLKFRDWLVDLEHHAEDVVVSVSMSNDWLRLEAEAALAPAGFVLAVRMALSNEPPQLKYAFVASEKRVGFYSPWRKSKFTFETKGTELLGYIHLVPNRLPGHMHEHQFTVGAGVSSQKSGRPFRIAMDLHPTVFIIEDPGKGYSLKNGVLTITMTNRLSPTPTEVQIDAATGRLLQYLQRHDEGDPRGDVCIRAEEGAFARLLKEIAAATPDSPNEYITNRGFSSWLSFLATDLIESPLIERVFRKVIEERAPEDRRTNALAGLKKVKPFLGLAREVFNKQNFASVFEPLDRLVAAKEDSDDEDTFFLPLDDSMANYTYNPMLWFCAVVLVYSDAMLTRDSWPWVLLRETAFTLAGQGKYAQAELDKLLKSDETGPLGYLATARLLGEIDPRLARTFAERGLSRLTGTEFRKDYRILLQSDSITSEILANALGLVRILSDTQTTALATNLPKNETALVRQLAQLVREGKDQSNGAAAAWPAFEQHWDNTMRRYLEAGLNRFLPQVQFLTNSAALYQRGLAIIAPDAVLQDFDEAAQCFRKAAEQGHPGAQLNLGLLYGQGRGVRQDWGEAMRWYQKAAEQKEAHAACRMADLYRDGKGVLRDMDEAERWYRIEAEGDCTGSHFNLGRICDSQNKIHEALRWYRRAAEAGHVGAQAHMGDFLSDGFFTTPDYVEAGQWLTLAARAGDKLSENRLRRVKAKLSTEQLAEVQKRADAISMALITEKEKRRSTHLD